MWQSPCSPFHAVFSENPVIGAIGLDDLQPLVKSANDLLGFGVLQPGGHIQGIDRQRRPNELNLLQRVWVQLNTYRVAPAYWQAFQRTVF